MAILVCLDCGYQWETPEERADAILENGEVHVPCYITDTVNKGRIIKRSLDYVK